MAKTKQVFFCQSCGFESTKWLGQCPGCKEWNTLVEETVVKKTSSQGVSRSLKERTKPTSINVVSSSKESRIETGIGELDRVLGGGIVSGSLVLVGGDPGIGKSTLLLQVCRNLTKQDLNVLYVSGEESVQQIKMRADRMGSFKDSLMLYSETDIDDIAQTIKEVQPKVVVIDSIQTMYVSDVTSAAGSVSQVREVTARLLQIAKQIGVAIFIVGHVTKEGVVAGPRTLEHMVDTVLYFEGERYAAFRILRGVKNRFGSTNELGVFEMRDTGLEEVLNPSKALLEGRPEEAAGSVVVCSMEGTRPLLVEIQALLTNTNFNMPRRTSVGLDFNRVNLLIAVLEKKAGVAMGNCDAYVNIAGGIRIGEPAIDLGMVAAMLSSYRNRGVDQNTLFFGEVGLTGEVRGVNMAEQRVKEAEKMGFKTCIMPASNVKYCKGATIKLIGISNVGELLNYI